MGVEGWVVGEGEDFAGIGVDGDEFAAVGFDVFNGVAEFLLGDHLEVGVDGEDEVLAVLRGEIVLRVDADGSALGVFHFAGEAGEAGELGIVFEFEAVEARAVGAASAEDVGGE